MGTSGGGLATRRARGLVWGLGVIAGLVPAMGLGAGLPNSTRLFDEAADRVFKIGLADSVSGELQGHGTAFVVGRDGLLATAYHVVEQALFPRGKKGLRKVYVIRKGGRLEAQLMAADARRDVAILKVPLDFPEPWPIRTELVPNGTAVALLGFPGSTEFSVNNGTIQSARLSHVVPSYQITAPAMGGMSGGPVLDAQNQVVGSILAGMQGSGLVVVAGQGQNLQALLERAKALAEPPSPKRLVEEVHASRFEEQAKQAALVQNLLRERTLFHGWKLAHQKGESDEVRCHESPESDSKWSAVGRRSCEFRNTGLGSGVEFALRYVAIPPQSNRFRAADLAERELNDTRRLAPSEVRDARFHCQPDRRARIHGRAFSVSICSRVLAKDGMSYQTLVRASSLDFTRTALVARLELIGFNHDNTEELTAAFVESLEASDEGS